MSEAGRRKEHRFMLKLSGETGHCTAEVGGVALLDCELMDISSGGLRGLITSGQPMLAPLEKGHHIELTAFNSDNFDFVIGKTGVIAWYSDATRQFGVGFHEEIPHDEVEAMIFHFTFMFQS